MFPHRSVVIVGVGGADFDAMEVKMTHTLLRVAKLLFCSSRSSPTRLLHSSVAGLQVLDADDTPLRCGRTGRTMARDIVQFVPYRDFKHGGPERLAAEVRGGGQPKETTCW